MVSFYHCTREPLLLVVPKLAAKAYASGHRLLIRADDVLLDALDEALWTFDTASFLPHGRDDADLQPILLRNIAVPLNGADVLMQCAVALPEPLDAWARVLHIFEDGSEAHAGARTEWKTLGAAGVARTYWRQDASGRWEEAG